MVERQGVRNSGSRPRGDPCRRSLLSLIGNGPGLVDDKLLFIKFNAWRWSKQVASIELAANRKVKSSNNWSRMRLIDHAPPGLGAMSVTSHCA